MHHHGQDHGSPETAKERHRHHGGARRHAPKRERARARRAGIHDGGNARTFIARQAFCEVVEHQEDGEQRDRVVTLRGEVARRGERRRIERSRRVNRGTHRLQNDQRDEDPQTRRATHFAHLGPESIHRGGQYADIAGTHAEGCKR